jgi:2-amino-4-hydroxy-6-hydroxymethyldihydropteridine diphosphokinase
MHLQRSGVGAGVNPAPATMHRAMVALDWMIDPGSECVMGGRSAGLEVAIGLGANLGDCRQTLVWALQEIAGWPMTSLQRVSSLYASAPVDADGPDFLNAVALIHTCMTAPDVLAALLALERRAGRERPYINAPRTLDLDLLLYGSARIQSGRLTVPHPRMYQRAFVMVPLVEINPDCWAAEPLNRLRAEQTLQLAERDWFVVQA